MALDTFRGIEAFVAVAEEQSFRKAGVRLGVSAAALSKAVQALEAETGMTLLARGGRSVTLTREGETLFAHARPAVQSVLAGRAALESGRRQPQGELVISAPFVAAELIAPAIALLAARHPRLTYSLRITDRVTRLGEEGVDVAVRIGAMPSSELITRRLRTTKMWTVATPAYLARAGTPRTIEDLAQHACIGAVGPRGKPFEWLFASGPRPVAQLVLTDHAPTVLDAALASLGVTQLFDFVAEPRVRAGILVPLLESEVATGPDVVAVRAPGQRSSPRVRAAIDALVESFAR